MPLFLDQLLSNAVKFTNAGVVALKLSAHPVLSHAHAHGGSRRQSDRHGPSSSDPSFTSPLVGSSSGGSRCVTPSGMSPLQVSRDASGSGSGNGNMWELHFEVVDTGIGIPESAQSRLFHSFSQGHRETNRLYGGTGLGLAISKSLTQLLGGRIYFTSVAEEGSRFHLHLPMRCVPPESLPLPMQLRLLPAQALTRTATEALPGHSHNHSHGGSSNINSHGHNAPPFGTGITPSTAPVLPAAHALEPSVSESGSSIVGPQHTLSIDLGGGLHFSSSSSASSGVAGKFPLQGRRVLLLHRHPVALQLLSRMVEDWGATAVPVTNVNELEAHVARDPSFLASLLAVCVDLPSVLTDRSQQQQPQHQQQHGPGGDAHNGGASTGGSSLSLAGSAGWSLLARLYQSCQAAHVPHILLVPLGSQRRNMGETDAVITHPIKSAQMLQLLVNQTLKRGDNGRGRHLPVVMDSPHPPMSPASVGEGTSTSAQASAASAEAGSPSESSQSSQAQASFSSSSSYGGGGGGGGGGMVVNVQPAPIAIASASSSLDTSPATSGSSATASPQPGVSPYDLSSAPSPTPAVASTPNGLSFAAFASKHPLRILIAEGRHARTCMHSRRKGRAALHALLGWRRGSVVVLVSRPNFRWCPRASPPTLSHRVPVLLLFSFACLSSFCQTTPSTSASSARC